MPPSFSLRVKQAVHLFQALQQIHFYTSYEAQHITGKEREAYHNEEVGSKVEQGSLMSFVDITKKEVCNIESI